jgi:hypothetical protein
MWVLGKPPVELPKAAAGRRPMLIAMSCGLPPLPPPLRRQSRSGRTIQRNEMWFVPVSIGWCMRAAGR